jgi:hypothetical protein
MKARDACAEIETWKDRAAINGKRAFEIQDERDNLRRALERAKLTLRDIKEIEEQIHLTEQSELHADVTCALAEIERLEKGGGGERE